MAGRSLAAARRHAAPCCERDSVRSAPTLSLRTQGAAGGAASLCLLSRSVAAGAKRRRPSSDCLPKPRPVRHRPTYDRPCFGLGATGGATSLRAQHSKLSQPASSSSLWLTRLASTERNLLAASCCKRLGGQLPPALAACLPAELQPRRRTHVSRRSRAAYGRGAPRLLAPVMFSF